MKIWNLIVPARQAIAAVMLGCLGTFASAAPVVSVTAADSLFEGASFDVDIRIEGVDDLYSFQFDLTFDPSLVRVLSVAQGSFLPASGETFPVLGNIDNANGVVEGIADTLIADVVGASGDGLLFSVRLRALRAGFATLSLANEIYLDSALEDLSPAVSSSGAVVEIKRPVTPPPTVPEPGTWLLLGTFCLLSLFSRRSPRLAPAWQGRRLR